MHFDRPISPDHTCQHYIGYADDVVVRLQKHRTHPDARLVEVAKERGIKFVLARLWPGDRTRERQIKNWHKGPRLCPICQGEITYAEAQANEPIPF